MKNEQTNWKVQDEWRWHEFCWLMVLEFVFVIGGIKFILEPLYAHWFGNNLYTGTLMGLTIAVTLLAGVYLIALRPKRLSWSEVGVKPFAGKDWKLIILFSVLIMIGVVLFGIIVTLFGNSLDNEKSEAMQENISFFTILISFVSAAVISPIYEEIFYRGFIYRWLRTRIGIIGAVFLSSFIFTAAHVPTLNVMPLTFFGGILFAYAYERTNSVIPSMLIHGLTNGIMVLLASSG